MDFLDSIELYSALQEERFFKVSDVQFFGAQIVLALQALHKENMAHRDLKAENVLIDKYGYLTLIDYGLAVDLSGG